MGNGTFTRRHGGKTAKINLTQSALSRGYQVLVCLQCMGSWSTTLNRCVRCSWNAKASS